MRDQLQKGEIVWQNEKVGQTSKERNMVLSGGYLLDGGNDHSPVSYGSYQLIYVDLRGLSITITNKDSYLIVNPRYT